LTALAMAPIVKCHSDSTLREFKTTVVSVVKQEQKQSKVPKKKTDSPPIVGDVYTVITEDTILYPEGGGQPHDTGRMGELEVIDVQEVDGLVAHSVLVKEGQTIFEVGQSVVQHLDWNRRFDHMQQHSSQHLISAVFMQEFGFNTGSWWLATAPQECFIDLDCSGVSEEQLTRAEERANELIRAAVPMRAHIFPSSAEAREHEYFRTKPDGIPSNISGPVRVMEIAGIDFNLCCGTHLSNTSEMQAVHLTRVERVKDISRVFFLAGGRALNGLRQWSAMQKGLTEQLRCSPELFISNAARLVNDNRQQAKDLTQRTKELGGLLAAEILAKLKQSDETKLFVWQRDADVALCDAVAAALPQEELKIAVVLSARNPPPSLNAALPKDGAFYIVGPEATVSRVSGPIATAVNGRGGGRKGRFQGRATRLDLLADAVAQSNTALQE